MLAATVISRPLITWGVAARPLPSHTVSGDLHLVKPLPIGSSLPSLVSRRPAPALKLKSRTVKAAEAFFLETLSPFEAAHRGFRNAKLELIHHR